MNRNMKNIAKLEHLLITTEAAVVKARDAVRDELDKIAQDPIHNLKWRSDDLNKATAELEVITRIDNELILLSKDGETTEVDCTRIADTIRRLLIQETRYLSNRSSGTFHNIYKDFFITALSQFVDDSSYNMPFFYEAQRLDPEYVAWSDAEYAARRDAENAKKQAEREALEGFAAEVEVNIHEVAPKASVTLDDYRVKVRLIDSTHDTWKAIEAFFAAHKDRFMLIDSGRSNRGIPYWIVVKA
jgi:hypothetical protein